MGKVAVVAQEKQKFTPVFSETFIEFQLKDYEIRQQEIDFKKSQSEKNYEFAKDALWIQSEDLKDMREHEIKKERNSQMITILAILLLFTIVLFAMYLNKDEILIEFGKIAGYIFGGGITGYGLGLQKAKTDAKQVKPC